MNRGGRVLCGLIEAGAVKPLALTGSMLRSTIVSEGPWSLLLLRAG
jgi:hypothetical protein